jgi:hypothetical protein
MAAAPSSENYLTLSSGVSAGLEALATLEGAALRDVVRGTFATLTTASSGEGGKAGWAPPPLLGATDVGKAAAAALCTLVLEAAKLSAPKDVVKCVSVHVCVCRAWLVEGSMRAGAGWGRAERPCQGCPLRACPRCARQPARSVPGFTAQASRCGAQYKL